MSGRAGDAFVGPCEACGNPTLRMSDAVWADDGSPFCRGCLPSNVTALRAELAEAREAVKAAYIEGEENGIALAAKQPDALRGWENSRARAALDRRR